MLAYRVSGGEDYRKRNSLYCLCNLYVNLELFQEKKKKVVSDRARHRPQSLAASSQNVEITTCEWCLEEALSWAQNPHEGIMHLKGNIALTFPCIHFLFLILFYFYSRE